MPLNGDAYPTGTWAKTGLRNTSKYRPDLTGATAGYKDVLNPFDIQDGWFQLELVGFQVVPNPDLDDPIRLSVEQTIERLGLNEFSRERAERAEDYWAHDVTLKILTTESPFVARELQRQGRLLLEDK
jgi:hypothetical protein